METLISLLILLLVIGILFWCFQRVISLFPGAPAPLVVTIEVLIGILCIYLLMGYSGGNLIPIHWGNR